MTIFTIGETRQKNSFKEHLDVGYRHWPIDLSSFCFCCVFVDVFVCVPEATRSFSMQSLFLNTHTNGVPHFVNVDCNLLCIFPL